MKPRSTSILPVIDQERGAEYKPVFVLLRSPDESSLATLVLNMYIYIYTFEQMESQWREIVLSTFRLITIGVEDTRFLATL